MIKIYTERIFLENFFIQGGYENNFISNFLFGEGIEKFFYLNFIQGENGDEVEFPSPIYFLILILIF